MKDDTWKNIHDRKQVKLKVTGAESAGEVALTEAKELGHWKNFGETSTPEGHKLFFSGREDRHEHGVGLLIHKDTVNAIMGCRPVSS